MAELPYFSSDEMIRYSRQFVLRHIGVEGQKKLKRAKIAVAGVGGLGGYIALSLAGMGVGFLRIIDNDIVDLSNLHRQTNFEMNKIGRPKVEAIEERIKKVNPNVKVESSTYTIDLDTSLKLADGIDIIVDGLDKIMPRIAINRASITKKIPYVHAGVLETYGNISTFVPGRTGCLECNISESLKESDLTCETVGVLPSAVTVIASFEVNEVVSLIVGGRGLLENQLCVVDLSIPSLDMIPFQKNPNCKVCESNYTKSIRKTSIVQSCGKNKFVVSPPNTANLDFSKISVKLSRYFKVKLQTRYSINLAFDQNIEVSIMTTGNMLIKGAKDQAECEKIYNKVNKVISK